MHIGEIVITVLSGVKERQIPKKLGTAGETQPLRYQEAEVMLPGGRHPRDCEVRPPRNGEYPPGRYRIAAKSLEVNSYGSLQMRYIDLVPAAAAVASADRKAG